MKRVIAIVMLLLMAGCSEPLPQDQWKQNEIDLQRVSGLQDCKMFTIKRATASDPIHVIRCPNSTTDTQYSISRGKSGRSHFNTSVIDEAAQAQAERVKAAELELQQAQTKLDKIRAAQ